MVHPLAMEVIAEERAPIALQWVRLREAVEARELLRDGHLRIVALRAAHALGIMSRLCAGRGPG